MIDVYTDWVTDFIGHEPVVKTFDGTSLMSRFRGLKYTYAYFKPTNKTFGYNKSLMDKLDEADVLTIAVHESGHYWKMNRDIIMKPLVIELVIVAMVLMHLMIFAFIGVFFLIGYMMKNSVKAEHDAEDFVRSTIGPGLSLNNEMLLILDIEPAMISGLVAKQIKDSLKELGIEYENCIET